MAGTRTAPTVDGTPSYLRISFSLLDASDDERSISIDAPNTASNAQIESMGVALQALTNATLWRITVSPVYEGAKSAANADDAVHLSVFDNVVMHCKDSVTRASQQVYVPAPTEALVPAGADVVDTGLAAYSTWKAAVLAVLAGDYGALTVRYTERREKNDSISA